MYAPISFHNVIVLQRDRQVTKDANRTCSNGVRATCIKRQVSANQRRTTNVVVRVIKHNVSISSSVIANVVANGDLLVRKVQRVGAPQLVLHQTFPVHLLLIGIFIE